VFITLNPIPKGTPVLTDAAGFEGEKIHDGAFDFAKPKMWCAARWRRTCPSGLRPAVFPLSQLVADVMQRLLGQRQLLALQAQPRHVDGDLEELRLKFRRVQFLEIAGGDQSGRHGISPSFPDRDYRGLHDGGLAGRSDDFTLRRRALSRRRAKAQR
jgi:hypothetical protein